MSSGKTGSGATAAKIPSTLIDVHCHVFNAADLPAAPFIYRVVRQRYSADPDALVVGLGIIISALTGNAPTAAAELDDCAADEERRGSCYWRTYNRQCIWNSRLAHFVWSLAPRPNRKARGLL